MVARLPALASAAAPSKVAWVKVYVAVHVVLACGSRRAIRLVLPGLQSKPVQWVEDRDVLLSLVLPVLATVMVAVTTASAKHMIQAGSPIVQLSTFGRAAMRGHLIPLGRLQNLLHVAY